MSSDIDQDRTSPVSIVPSVLPADYSRLGEEVAALDAVSTIRSRAERAIESAAGDQGA